MSYLHRRTAMTIVNFSPSCKGSLFVDPQSEAKSKTPFAFKRFAVLNAGLVSSGAILAGAWGAFSQSSMAVQLGMIAGSAAFGSIALVHGIKECITGKHLVRSAAEIGVSLLAFASAGYQARNLYQQIRPSNPPKLPVSKRQENLVEQPPKTPQKDQSPACGPATVPIVLETSKGHDEPPLPPHNQSPNPLFNPSQTESKPAEPMGIHLVTNTQKTDEVSQLVLDNQQQYANLHGYTFQAFEGNRAKECRDKAGRPQECDPQWSKVAIIRDWLNDKLGFSLAPWKPNRWLLDSVTQDNSKEEWLVWMNEDTVITHPHYKLEEMIQRSRAGKQTSVILVKEMQRHGGEETQILADSDGISSGPPYVKLSKSEIPLLNTGMLLVRVDEVSKRFFNQFWERRNWDANLPEQPFATMGTCQAPACEHEQDVLSAWLEHRVRQHQEKAPHHTLTEVISAVSPRVEIPAFNTFARVNSYFDEAKNKTLDYTKDNPQARWQPGDFAGQCSGIPTDGRSLDARGTRSERGNLRLDCVKRLSHFFEHFLYRRTE